MSLENASQAESSTTSTESSASEASTQSTSTESTQTSGETTNTETPAPAYTPNYDFKVYDKVQQFPEWIRPHIKDKANEDHLRDIYSRAYGLDGLKGKYEKSKEQIASYSEMERKFNAQSSELKNIIAMRDTDLGAFMQAVGLTDEMLHQHYQLIARAKEDPLFAAQYNQGLEAKRNHLKATQDKSSLEEQIASLNQERQQFNYEKHLSSFETAISQPQVSAFATSFDQRAGKEGAFRAEALDLGNYIFMKEKRNAPASEVFNMLMQKYGAFVQPQTAPTESTQLAAKTTATIPNTGGGSGVSPTQPRFKSIEDIKKHYERKYGD